MGRYPRTTRQAVNKGCGSLLAILILVISLIIFQSCSVTMINDSMNIEVNKTIQLK